MGKILLLIDYHRYFYWAARPICTLDVPLLLDKFRELGFEVEVRNFSQVRFREIDCAGTYVLYTSQEDPDLRYKDFIEDIILGLQEKGAILIPAFRYFRAHHNKVFMEILRDLSSQESVKNIQSRYFGSLEEYREYGNDVILPAVIKPSAGATSAGVALLRTRNEALIRKVSSSFVLEDFLKNLAKWLMNHRRPPRSLHRNKFIVQNFVEELSGDYKILVFGDDYYVLRREVRRGDFRASGSGMFSWPEEVSSGILSFAEEVFTSMSVPYVSLDIAERNGECFLLEFQAIMFGTLTLEGSSFSWRRQGRDWNKVEGARVLEEEFAKAVFMHVQKRFGSPRL